MFWGILEIYECRIKENRGQIYNIPIDKQYSVFSSFLSLKSSPKLDADWVQGKSADWQCCFSLRVLWRDGGCPVLFSMEAG